MSDGFKTKYTKGESFQMTEGSYVSYGIHVSKPPNDTHYDQIQVHGNEHLRDYILDVLNNPPDPLDKVIKPWNRPAPEKPGYVTVFEHRGERFELRGDERAVEAFKAIFEFYNEVVRNVGAVKKLQPQDNEPHLTETSTDAGNNGWHRHHFRRDADFERRLAELEKTVHVLSTQPMTPQEHQRRMTVLANWNTGTPAPAWREWGK